jgi:hypothetical protein
MCSDPSDLPTCAGSCTQGRAAVVRLCAMSAVGPPPQIRHRRRLEHVPRCAGTHARPRALKMVTPRTLWLRSVRPPRKSLPAPPPGGRWRTFSCEMTYTHAAVGLSRAVRASRSRVLSCNLSRPIEVERKVIYFAQDPYSSTVFFQTFGSSARK